MKESTAWLILAREHFADRTPSRFLCVSLECAEGALAGVPYAMRNAMKERIQLEPPVAQSALAYVINDLMTDKEERDGRVMACLMFGQQARDEERAT